jgi:nucleotide-binding universal stress UspA family protein
MFSSQGVKAMAYKTLLCMVGATHNDVDLKICMDLTLEINAHCSVLVLSEAPTLPVGFYGEVIPDAWYDERKLDVQKLQKRVDAIEFIVKDAGISADVNCEYVEQAMMPETVGRHARYADLVICGPTLLADKYLGPNTKDGVLFHSGRPLLLVPKGSKPTLNPKQIVVACDGSVEAMRAMREALDIVSKADQVRVVMVDPQPYKVGEEPGADEAAYLSRHGAKVIVDRLPSSGSSVPEVLGKYAKDQGTDLLVMGAYGHSRLRERLFGGVTKDVLLAPPMPVLLAH